MEVKIDYKVKEYLENKNKNTLKIDTRATGC